MATSSEYNSRDEDPNTRDGSQAANLKTMRRSTFTGRVLFSIPLTSIMPAVAFPHRGFDAPVHGFTLFMDS